MLCPKLYGIGPDNRFFRHRRTAMTALLFGVSSIVVIGTCLERHNPSNPEDMTGLIQKTHEKRRPDALFFGGCRIFRADGPNDKWRTPPQPIMPTSDGGNLVPIFKTPGKHEADFHDEMDYSDRRVDDRRQPEQC